MNTHRLIDDFMNIDEKYLLEALEKEKVCAAAKNAASDGEPIEVREHRTSPLKTVIPIAAAALLIAAVPVGITLLGGWPTRLNSAGSKPGYTEPVSSQSGESENGTSSVSDTDSGSAESEAYVPFRPEIENFTYSVDYNGGEPTELPFIRAGKQRYDAGKLKSLFLDGKTITEEETDEEKNRTLVFTEDGCTLVVNNSRAAFSASTGDHTLDYTIRDGVSYIFQDSEKNFPHRSDELEDFPKAEALARADEIVTALDIKYLGKPTVYTLKGEDLHNFYDVYPLREDADCYFVVYLTEYKGVPVSTSIGMSNIRSYVIVTLKKDMLVSVEIEDTFDEIEETGKCEFNCGSDEAADTLFRIYSEMFGIEFPIEFTELKTVYIKNVSDKSDSDYQNGIIEYRPLWEFWGYEDRTMMEVPSGAFTPKFRTQQRYVDPRTGAYLGG